MQAHRPSHLINDFACRDHTVADGLDYVATWNAGILYSEDMPEMAIALKEKRRPVFSKL